MSRHAARLLPRSINNVHAFVSLARLTPVGLALVWLAGSGLIAAAQNIQSPAQTADQMRRGVSRVEPTTLAVGFHLPLGTLPGRGGTSLPITAHYSSKVWQLRYQGFTPDIPGGRPGFQAYPQGLPNEIQYSSIRPEYDATAGWRLSIRPPRVEPVGDLYDVQGFPTDDSSINAQYVRRLRVVWADGGSAELRAGDAVVWASSPPTYPLTYVSVDGERLRYEALSEQRGVLYLPDGSQWRLDTGWNAVQVYRDRHGNQVRYANQGAVVTDSLGRELGGMGPLSALRPPERLSPGVYTVNVPGFGGRWVTYRMRWRRLEEALREPSALRRLGDVEMFGPACYGCLGPSLFQSGGGARVISNAEIFNPVVLTEIELPTTTPTRYEFRYNVYGEVEQVAYPWGGYERFQYAPVAALDPLNEPYPQGNRGVTERRVSATGLPQDEQVWRYGVVGGGWASYALRRSWTVGGLATRDELPSGREQGYAYDAAGRLTATWGRLGDGAWRMYAEGITYTARGALAQEAFGTGTRLWHTRRYNARGQLYDVRVGTGSVYGTRESWDRGCIQWLYTDDMWGAGTSDPWNNGNIKRQQVWQPLGADGARLWMTGYEYDGLNRLTWAGEYHDTTEPEDGYVVYGVSYGYDRWGNRVCGGQGWRAGWADRASVGALARRGPDGRRVEAGGRPVGSDEPIRWSAPGCVAVGVDGGTNRLVGSGIGYDANGNLTWDGVTGQGARVYDGENRLVQAAGEGGGLWRYVYDADGRRVKLNVGRGDERWLVYGVDGAVVAEYAAQGAAWQPVVEYGYRNGELLVIGEGWRCRWVVSDVVGSVRLVVDQTGSAAGVKRRDYMPYGEDLGAGVGGRSAQLGYEAAVPSDPRKKYGTYERDDGTGLDYAQARYYQSRLGRFTSVDPLLASGRPEEPQTWHRYSYVGGQATTVTDESGLIWLRNKLTGQIGWYAGHRAPRGYDELEVGTILAVEHGRGRFKNLEGHWVKLGANGKPIDLGLLPGDDTAIDFQHGLGTDFAIAYAQHVGGALVGAFAAAGVISLGAKLLPAVSSAAKTADKFSRTPKSLMDQMVLDAAKQGKGVKIVDNLGDLKFKGMEKWSYTEKSAAGFRSEVHYMRDPKTGKLMDFKFKHHAEKYK